MRLPAKNATAPVVAFVLAVTGACEAASQSARESGPARLSGSGAGENAPARSEAARTPHAAAPSRHPAFPPVGGALERRARTDAGLRHDYWSGTPYSLVAETLPRLPVRIASPAVRRLTIEMLTAPAEPLQGAAFAARLAAVRAERLYAMGQLEAADALFSAAPPAAGETARAPAEIETKLLLHGYGAGCAALTRHRGAGDSLYFERADVACDALAGAHAKAAQGLGRLRDRGMPMGEAFDALVIAQQAELARPLAALGAADAWTVRLLAATGLRWPEDAARLAAPALLRVVAESANGPDAARIAAAERAFILGAVDRVALVALYSSVRFREAALREAERLQRGGYSPLQRALLFQAAMRVEDRRRRLEILANWWRLARAERDEALAALVTAPLLFELAPGAEWRENAPAISRVFFHAGELERALAWYGLIRDATFKDMESYMRLGALAQLAQRTGKGWTAAEAQAWAAYQRDRWREDGERRIAVLRALETGLGPVAGTGTERAEAGGRVPGGELVDWRDARAAARAGRQGEAILLMLTALGHDGVARAEPRALGAAVGVLTTLGREAEARRLAVEAALANGF
jgi:hypothetical protein